jgi:Dolichyl-phosphate-mannose-protein mannosyltransferase
MQVTISAFAAVRNARIVPAGTRPRPPSHPLVVPVTVLGKTSPHSKSELVRPLLSVNSPASSDPPPRPRARAYVLLLAATLVASGALLIQTAMDLLSVQPPKEYRMREFIVAVVASLAIFWSVLTVRRAKVGSVLVLAGPVVATALLTPATVLVVACVFLSALVLGEIVLSWVAGRAADAQTHPAADISMLAGISLWIGLIAAAAPLKVHYAPVYSIALLVPLLASPQRTAAAIRRVGRSIVEDGPAMHVTERIWAAALLTLVVLHLFVVAKPEVGYDAGTMHLQFAQLLAKYHAWPFDITRYVWADMPLGADYAFAAAYQLGGEPAARLLNLGFAAIACHIVYRLVRRYARREVALASVCLLASMPLMFLITGSLLSEALWAAFLLGTLVLTLDYAREASPVTLAAIALLAAGAMQAKAIAIVWVAPLVLFLAWLVWRRGNWRNIDRRAMALILVAAVIGVWPYANAWARTGNPVFPFMNAVFRSPYFDSAVSFTNPLYLRPLAPGTLYELVRTSSRFIEGYDGAAGLHWLLLAPVIVVAFTRRRPATQWLCLAFAAIFFVGVYTQQAYLRYLLPAFIVVAVVGGWALDDVAGSGFGRIGLLLVGGSLCLLNLRFVYAAHWPNTTLCPSCAFDAKARTDYLGLYGPDRAVSDYLNRNLPDARVVFFNAPSPSGYIGYSRSDSWHDVPAYRELRNARTAEDVLAVTRHFQLTHAAFVETGRTAEEDPIVAFCQRYTVPLWQYAGRTVAKIQGP